MSLETAPINVLMNFLFQFCSRKSRLQYEESCLDVTFSLTLLTYFMSWRAMLTFIHIRRLNYGRGGGTRAGINYILVVIKQAVWPPGSADTVCPRQPLTVTFDRLTLKLACESHLGNVSSKFGHARPLDSRIIRYVRDGRTDRRTDGQKQRLLPPTVGGISSQCDPNGRRDKTPPPSLCRALQAILLLGQSGQCPTRTRCRRETNAQTHEQTNAVSAV